MPSDPRFTAEIELTIPFHDVDMMGTAWYDNYFRYFEVAREVLLNRFNYGYRQMRESSYSWPVVSARVKYHYALTLEQRICVRVYIEELKNCLRTNHQIFDAETGKRATTGYTIQVAVDEQSRELCLVGPDILLEYMGVKP